jgi:hypothetical protein
MKYRAVGLPIRCGVVIERQSNKMTFHKNDEFIPAIQICHDDDLRVILTIVFVMTFRVLCPSFAGRMSILHIDNRAHVL